MPIKSSPPCSKVDLHLRNDSSRHSSQRCIGKPPKAPSAKGKVRLRLTLKKRLSLVFKPTHLTITNSDSMSMNKSMVESTKYKKDVSLIITKNEPCKNTKDYLTQYLQGDIKSVLLTLNFSAVTEDEIIMSREALEGVEGHMKKHGVPTCLQIELNLIHHQFGLVRLHPNLEDLGAIRQMLSDESSA